MERFLLCALVLLRPMDALDGARTQEPSFQARTTRGLPLCLEGKGQKPQHLDGPAGQGTPCPSLTAGSSSSKDGKTSPEYWIDKTIDLLLILGAMLLSILICWCISLCWKALCPALRRPEQIRLQTLPSPNGRGEYGAITDAHGTLPSAAEGQVSPPVEKEEDDVEKEEDNDDKATLLSTIDSHREAVTLYGLEDKTEPKSAM